VTCSDEQCADAFFKLCRLGGLIPAIESAHALAHALVNARNEDRTILVNLSGRGDKDLDYVLENWGTGTQTVVTDATEGRPGHVAASGATQ
jgi:tryptophan synthase beta subunit